MSLCFSLQQKMKLLFRMNKTIKGKCSSTKLFHICHQTQLTRSLLEQLLKKFGSETGSDK